MPKLTKSVVDAAKPREKQYTIWCDSLKGFGVCINPSGSKSYLADYRNAEGVRRRMTIGRHGPLTTEEARKMAMGTLGEVVSQKEDPVEERRTRRKSITLAELCDDYLAAARNGLILGRNGKAKKASTLDTDAGRIERHIKPLLGSKRVIDLKRSDVSQFIRDVTAGKTAMEAESKNLRGKVIVKGGAGTAARTTGLLGGILSYAVDKEIIETNPVHGVRRPADKKKERRLSPAELRALGKALDGAETEAWQGIAGIKLLLFTGCRINEINHLEWHEVDFHGRAIQFGDTKTGAQMRPLTQPAMKVLAEVPGDRKGFVLSPIRKDTGAYGSLDNAIDRITQAAGLKGVTAHVLRHTFASVGGDLEYSENTIGAIIGHSKHGITSRYVHRLDSVLVAAADKIALEVEQQLNGTRAAAFPDEA